MKWLIYSDLPNNTNQTDSVACLVVESGLPAPKLAHFLGNNTIDNNNARLPERLKSEFSKIQLIFNSRQN
jgi:hypothetical protein